MSSQEDALLFLDQDKGRGLGAEERRRLGADPRLRSGWLQYQALQALALEAAPAPSERMTREVLAHCRREQVSRRLSSITGADALAREILLEDASARDRGPVWLYALGLTGLLALAWLAWRGLNPAQDGRDATLLSAGVPASVPFEFPVQTPPADAALAGPADTDGASGADADDVHDEAPAARQASRLLRDTLQAAQKRELEGDDDGGSDAPRPAPRAVAPAGAKPLRPLAFPAKTSPVAALSIRAVTLTASASALSGTAALRPGLTLSSDSLLASASTAADGTTSTSVAGAGPLDIRVDLPLPRAIDVRLFSPSGQSVRVLGSGLFGPGSVHFSLDAKDAKGQILAPGTYYLRVMTPWFSRVEPIQIH